MRKYNADNTVLEVRCNMCGKQLKVENGIVKEGIFSSKYQWDYFSEKDGQIYAFDLCEACYDAMIKKFRIMPEIKESNEMI